MNRKIKTDNLYLVDVRFYDKDMGVEVPYDYASAKAVVFEDDGYYYDVISGNLFPYLKRVPYSNISSSYCEYGTKLMVENKDLISDEGTCYVESYDQDFVEKIKENSEIEYSKLEDLILNSRFFFPSRLEIITDRMNVLKKHPLINKTKIDKLFNIIVSDYENNISYNQRMRNISLEKKEKVLNLLIG